MQSFGVMEGAEHVELQLQRFEGNAVLTGVTLTLGAKKQIRQVLD